MVSYDDRPILNHLSWTVNPCEHWQIVGPNGAGKSTLLSLITGDHPQGYSNDLTLFGRRRGSGETIWDIKKHIGYVSSSLHLDYRVSTTVRNVILPGTLIPSVFIRRYRTNSTSWPSSGWIFWDGQPSLTRRFTVCPGAAAFGIDRPGAGETPDAADPR